MGGVVSSLSASGVQAHCPLKAGSRCLDLARPSLPSCVGALVAPNPNAGQGGTLTRLGGEPGRDLT